jgi:DamX protein
MDEHFNINPDIVDREEAVAPRDPFADEWSGVAYADEAGKLNLNKLLHLAPYSEVLLVSGPEGVGKSTLLNQFVVGAKKSWKVVHLRASSLMTTEEFLRQIIHGFSLPSSAGVDEIEDMLVEIGRHLQALGRSGRRAIVVIDDAHLLADAVIVIVEHILSDERSTSAISLVLGVDDGAAVVSRLDHFPVLLHKLAYTLRLEPMAEADVAGYIRHRLVHTSNLAAEPLFSDAVINRIYSQSGGLPGKINALARGHLNRKGGISISGRTLMRGGLALAGVAVVGAVLLFQDQINQLVAPAPKAPEVVSELAVPAVSETAVVTEGQEVVAPEVVAEEPVDGGVESAPALSMGELGSQPESQSVAVPVTVDVAPQTPAKMEEPKPETITATKPQPVAPVVAPKPSPAQTSTPAAKAVIESAVKSVAKAPEKTPEKVETKSWLQSQNPEHFTLQLMALLDESDVKQFVKKHKLQSQSEIFYITRKGNKLAALVYGSYPDRAAVDAAAKALPKEWGVKDPWVRTFASVKEDMKSN